MRIKVSLGRKTKNQLDRIELGIRALLVQQGEIMTDLSALDAAVSAVEAETAAQTDVGNSVVTLLTQLSGVIDSLKTDPAALEALAERLSAASTSGVSVNQLLADAVVSNTPAAPPA